jgi:AcrR family transcriptional regulator
MASDRRRSDARPASVVEKVADKVSGKMAEKAAKLNRAADKVSEKAARQEAAAARMAKKAAALDRVAEQLGGLDIWMRPEPQSRRPRLTRDAIAEAAVRIADTEGFDAVSMRRIAAELEAGTMTLYHYVRTKDELLSLVLDSIMGELVVPDGEPIPDDWRAALTLIAERTRAALERHPWILDITDDPPIGPNSVRHFDQTLQAAASLPLDLADKFDIVSVVDEYVFGFCLHHRNNQQHAHSSDADLAAYVNGLVATGDYPQLAAMGEEQGLEAAWRQVETHLANPGRFRRNLKRLLDGIEADLPDRSA